ncbi:hypothetical protein C0993_011124 [Termitomyces sp. T159_Od127]|nr:hypothetical protein C0993_011124 [Termitomyces sp. T159_Od127]
MPKPSPSHLARVIHNLNASPKLTLTNLKSLKLSLAFQNDHFGARCVVHIHEAESVSDVISISRHFVKEQLPRIRWANPDLDIQVEKWRKTKEEAWRPEMEVEFADGTQKTIDMHEKWSTTILKELMEVAGGESWTKWKREAQASGRPVVPGEENENKVVKRPTPESLPSLKAFRAAPPPPDPKATVPPADSVPKAGVSAALP